jgi:hypothetical protein
MKHGVGTSGILEIVMESKLLTLCGTYAYKLCMTNTKHRYLGSL